MAVPRNRHSNARKKSRRATYAKSVTNLTTCPACGADHPPHHVCPSCGRHGSTMRADLIKSTQE